MKDHEIAQTVNKVCEIARQYANTQQLRTHIAEFLVPVLKPDMAAQVNNNEFVAYEQTALVAATWCLKITTVGTPDPTAYKYDSAISHLCAPGFALHGLESLDSVTTTTPAKPKSLLKADHYGSYTLYLEANVRSCYPMPSFVRQVEATEPESLRILHARVRTSVSNLPLFECLQKHMRRPTLWHPVAEVQILGLHLPAVYGISNLTIAPRSLDTDVLDVDISFGI